MNQSDIEVGGVYIGEGGRDRKVLDISGKSFRWVTYISKGRKSHCLLESFARWAKERVNE